jgi:CheY-like chemotaxis protein
MITILLVEDSDPLRRTYAEAIQLAGMSALEARDGVHALAILEACEVDIVVTDLLMPNMDGLELLMAMQELRIETPLVLMTGGICDHWTHEQDMTAPTVAAARALGAVSTLRKPLLPTELIREIVSQVGKQKSAVQSA